MSPRGNLEPTILRELLRNHENIRAQRSRMSKYPSSKARGLDSITYGENIASRPVRRVHRSCQAPLPRTVLYARIDRGTTEAEFCEGAGDVYRPPT